jgi:mono/diheme cytochrome c family protein
MRLKTVMVLLALAGLLALGFLVLIFNGPRMRRQPKLDAFEAAMPNLPPGSVAVERSRFQVPSATALARVSNPLTGTPEQLKHAQVYYGYYCLSCHGSDGRGNGPVGESYWPKPADLHLARIQSLPDGALLRASLLGAGHAPVLARVVHPDHRWHLLLHLRSFGESLARPAIAPVPLIPNGP